ncbi:MAG TPA: FkbM family methyltransferase [Ferrovibrio sp.]|uniref:FkbM family methyltransferase n=1 Tax=Ferrovibrio sp. TaxID=1917215 RepID=UPI002ED2E17E
MRLGLRPFIGRLRWIRDYPPYYEDPTRFALRTLLFTWREQLAGGDLEFEACGGCLFRSPRNNISSFIAAIFGQRDLNITRFWRRALPPGSVFFDIGGNIGLYAVPASQQVGGAGCVVSFEAHPAIYGYLLSNVARNCDGNITVENLAVGSESGETRIAFNGRNPGESHIATRTEQGETVPVVALDDYCARRGIARIDYIKIDVEGFEANVLRGARAMIAANPSILIQTEYEPQHLSRYGQPTEMADLLIGWGFRPHCVNWTDGAPMPLDSLENYAGEIVWSREELCREDWQPALLRRQPQPAEASAAD